MRSIPKGTLGESSKIREELEELGDAEDQGVKILCLVELSDLVGAIRAYLDTHIPGMTVADLEQMASVTRRAFQNGHR